MDWSEERGELIAAMVQMQGALEPVKKGSLNDFKGYKYADLQDILDACRRPLHDAGLAVLQATQPTERGLELVTTLVHTSGQWIRSRLPVLSTEHPQAMGSALTYARKYGLLTIVGLAADDDDDGQAAVPQRGQRSSQGSQRSQPNGQQRQQAQRQRPPQGQRQEAPRGRSQDQQQRQPPQAQQRQQPAQAQRQQAPAQDRPKAGPKPAPTDLEESPLDYWTRQIQTARSEAELRTVWHRFSKHIPKDAPLREALHPAWDMRRAALGIDAGRARQTDRRWAGD